MEERSQQSRSSPQRPSLRKNLLFTVIAVTGGLLLIEGGARLLLSVATPATPDGSRIESIWLDLLGSDLAAGGADPDLYVPDEDLFWTLRPHTNATVTNIVYETRGEPVQWTLRINSEGYRGPPYPDEHQSAAPVVVALGDSCTFGFRVDDEGTYPHHLQEYLREQGMPAAAVVNYGVPGYTTFQGERLLNDLLARHRPDVVVLAFGANDLELDRYSDAEKAARAGIALATISRWLDYSAFARLLRGPPDRSRTMPGSQPAQTTRVSDQEFRNNLLTMVRAAQGAGAQVVLVDLVLVAPVVRQTVAEVAAESGVPWIDARQALVDGLGQLLAAERFGEERAELDRFWDEDVQRYRQVYYDEAYYQRLFDDPIWSHLLRYLMIEPVHPNSLGHRLIAEAVGQEIVRLTNDRVGSEADPGKP